ncbi:MAG: hypothetical protein U1A78_38920 [Polyangia bacterium]
MGGAVFFWGSASHRLNVVNCQFLSNRAEGGIGGPQGPVASHGKSGAGLGGALFVLGQPTVVIQHSTFHNNSVSVASGSNTSGPAPEGSAIASYGTTSAGATAPAGSITLRSSLLLSAEASSVPVLARAEQNPIAYVSDGLNVLSGSAAAAAGMTGSTALWLDAAALGDTPRPPPSNPASGLTLVAPGDTLARAITTFSADPANAAVVQAAQSVCSASIQSAIALSSSPDLRGAVRAVAPKLCWPGALELSTPSTTPTETACAPPSYCQAAPRGRASLPLLGLLALPLLALARRRRDRTP